MASASGARAFYAPACAFDSEKTRRILAVKGVRLKPDPLQARKCGPAFSPTEPAPSTGGKSKLDPRESGGQGTIAEGIRARIVETRPSRYSDPGLRSKRRGEGIIAASRAACSAESCDAGIPK